MFFNQTYQGNDHSNSNIQIEPFYDVLLSNKMVVIVSDCLISGSFLIKCIVIVKTHIYSYLRIHTYSHTYVHTHSHTYTYYIDSIYAIILANGSIATTYGLFIRALQSF